MPETDTIPVSASIASTGLGIRYIGEHAYAYSGVNLLTNSETSYLDFTTGSGYIVGKIKISADWSGLSSSELYIQVYVNAEQIIFERIPATITFLVI